MPQSATPVTITNDLTTGGAAVPVSFPANLLTGTTNPRLRVDVAETGFFEKREFRTYREFSQPLSTQIPNGQRVLMRFVSTLNFILMDLSIVGDNGQIRMVSYIGGTPSGTFSTCPSTETW